MSEKQALLQKLSDCVFEMEEETVETIAQEYIEKGYEALDGILDGLVDGMNRAGQLYDEEEYFVSDLLLYSDAMYAGLEVLRPHLPENDSDDGKVRAVIGVIEGDTHDIGKNLVKIMMETAGFEMHDLGRDVPVEQFVDKAREINANLVCISTLMTTTMNGMARVVKRLEEESLKDSVKVMIGGAPISQSFADKIGADGYSANAVEAVKVARRLLSEKTAVAV